jgi:hypothetical protein
MLPLVCWSDTKHDTVFQQTDRSQRLQDIDASRFAQKVSRFFETAAPDSTNTTFGFNSYDTFLNAMATYGIEAVDLTSDTHYLEDIVVSFYSGTVRAEHEHTHCQCESSWSVASQYQPKYGDTQNVNTRSVAFLNRRWANTNSDVGTIFVGAQPSSVIRRQGLNYVVSGPRGEKAVFGTARDAQYYSFGKRQKITARSQKRLWVQTEKSFAGYLLNDSFDNDKNCLRGVKAGVQEIGSNQPSSVL